MSTPTVFALLLCLLTAGIAFGETHVEAPAGPPASVDLRPRLDGWNLTPRRQGDRGTCSVFAVTGALEFALASKTGHGERLSAEYLNWAAHHAVGRHEDGGFFSDLWSGFQRYGICSEAALPYRAKFDPALEPMAAVHEEARAARASGLKLHWIKEWDVKTGLTEDQLQEIRKTLASGWPVCGGMRWPKNEKWKDGVLQLCPPEQVFDGHSVLLVGYREDAQQPGGGVFLIRNSGGSGRDGALPYGYVRAYMNDAAWIEG